MRRLCWCAILPAALLFVTPASAQAPSKVAVGRYECWANNRPRLLLNFSIKNATQYIGSDDAAGAYTYTLSTTRITFKGGALDGVNPRGGYTIYHEPKGHPTVSFRNAEGSEISFCETVR